MRAARKRYLGMAPVLDEQSRRRLVTRLGSAWVMAASVDVGDFRLGTVHDFLRGRSDIRDKVSAPPGRIRKEGGGRKRKIIEDPTLVVEVKPGCAGRRGDPMRPLLWTSRHGPYRRILRRNRMSLLGV